MTSRTAREDPAAHHVNGPDALRIAIRASAGNASAPLRMVTPPGAVESLGPGWPRALAALFEAEWAAAHLDLSPPPVSLTLDCGRATGLALAVMADWPYPPGWTLTLVLAASVPPAAVAALRVRAAARGLAVAVDVAGAPD